MLSPWLSLAQRSAGSMGGDWPLLSCALTCRLFLKYRLAREFKLPDPGYALLFARDMLSFAIYFGSFLSPRVRWRGQDFTIARDGTLLARAEPPIGSASYGKAMR